MSSRGLSPLNLEIGVRRWEAALSGFALAIVTSVPWCLGLPAGWSVLVAAIASVSTAAALHRAGWLGASRRLQNAVWLADGRWLLTDGRGRCFDGMLRADSRVGAYYAWLRWDADRVRSMLLIGTDNGDIGFRQLIVRLRTEGNRRAADPLDNGNL